MHPQNTIKMYLLMGLTFMVASGCASTRSHAASDNDFAPVDTTRVAHVRYTPDGDYTNLEFIKNGRPTEKYHEIVIPPESDITFYGDTILMRGKKNIINISAQRRAHQR